MLSIPSTISNADNVISESQISGLVVGAGGLGSPISTGLNLNDTSRILEGAVPAALLALAVQGAFALLEQAIVPRGLATFEQQREGGAGG